jgi:ribonucleoside-diphosphate reductase alpha chain
MVTAVEGNIRIDYARLGEVARRAVHFLDNVIDVNEYPLPQIAEATLGNRRIGLGVMGWSDMLIRLGIPYASEQALFLAEKVMGFVQRTARRASVELACRRGAYPRHHPGADDTQAPRRNATVTTIAPTGTISLIAGCSGGIEPPFALSYLRKHILEGEELQETHPLLLAELSERRLDSGGTMDEIRRCGSVKGIAGFPNQIGEVYATALEISPEWHVQMQAAFQRHCDNAVSKTVNLPFEATARDVELVYGLAYRLGCKGITVYRDRSRLAQVLNTGCAACAWQESSG